MLEGWVGTGVLVVGGGWEGAGLQVSEEVQVGSPDFRLRTGGTRA